MGYNLVLITDTKSYVGFWLVPKSETLNGIMALILRYYTKFSSFWGRLHQSGWV